MQLGSRIGGPDTDIAGRVNGHSGVGIIADGSNEDLQLRAGGIHADRTNLIASAKQPERISPSDGRGCDEVTSVRRASGLDIIKVSSVSLGPTVVSKIVKQP